MQKLYYSISEVSKIVGVEPYVLRYWESEFSEFLKLKRENNRRLYKKENIEVLKEIRRLLYEEKYTIEGARQELRKKNKISATLLWIKKELYNILKVLK